LFRDAVVFSQQDEKFAGNALRTGWPSWVSRAAIFGGSLRRSIGSEQAVRRRRRIEQIVVRRRAGKTRIYLNVLAERQVAGTSQSCFKR